MSIYYFCNDCEHREYSYGKGGKLIKFTCPSRFNPWDEKCPKHERFMVLEEQKKAERLRALGGER